MKRMPVFERAESYVRSFFAGDSSGHDCQHTLRVFRTAITLAEEEHADPEITGLAALLHDVDDVKLSPDTCETKENAVRFLKAEGYPEEILRRIVTAIDEVSFRGTDSVVPSTPEGRCVQDADRLDAIGAVGIGRAFAFGGSRGREMYDPEELPLVGMTKEQYRSRNSCTINHFYEKLLLLKDRMCTDAGKKLAERRHRYMEEFLEEFLGEWNGTI